jgi:thiaminase
MAYGEIFYNLREKNLSNWLLYTQHKFLKKLSEGTLKKDCFLNYLKQLLLYWF